MGVVLGGSDVRGKQRVEAMLDHAGLGYRVRPRRNGRDNSFWRGYLSTLKAWFLIFFYSRWRKAAVPVLKSYCSRASWSKAVLS
tara:strand:- start:1538 stop:1789 length:252 start_codon:yes stop_codon:yes gene_type:complete